MKWLLFLIPLTLVMACGVSVNGSHQEKSESYKYQFDENGCDTGEHVATSFSGYCDNLKNDSLNNGCAYSTRKSTFQSAGCSGSM